GQSILVADQIGLGARIGEGGGVASEHPAYGGLQFLANSGGPGLGRQSHRLPMGERDGEVERERRSRLSDPLILVLDEGTTSTRAMLFDARGQLLGSAQRDIAQHYPRPGWVEHDAEEIWTSTLACAHQVVAQAGEARSIAAIGIANQRETVVAWDRKTGAPLSRAIVWQDRRTAEFCDQLRAAGQEDMVRRETGLLLDPYFSGTKMRWLLDNQPAVAEAAASGRLALGTVESWLVFRLTGGA